MWLRTAGATVTNLTSRSGLFPTRTPVLTPWTPTLSRSLLADAAMTSRSLGVPPFYRYRADMRDPIF
ncbi:hypothetical protein N7510_006444 [Penicillium lagena]|uniref:uncharacterized protein n=1 Tax=Penicillium lagena TaxID=94218 RepID=UPI00253FB52B|nr:uncharacterized protein N7510_006444 [Penicillium lagena]KAJ5613250.1 hypothetical protein N7510_006444 [Penicillium lagena]